MSTRLHLLQWLNDGAWHTGVELGQHLGISRAAVHKQIDALHQNGLELERDAGKGYRLLAPLNLLDRQKILAALPGDMNARLGALEIYESIDSTNAHLKKQALTEDAGVHVCAAEMQTAGQGRRGRLWHTSPYQNLMFSMAWRWPAGPTLLSGLSLVAGLVICETLKKHGVNEAGVKWPNDILIGERKVAGILLDMSGEVMGPSTIVLGIGINVALNSRARAVIDQQCIDLYELTGQYIDRNLLLADLVTVLIQAVDIFKQQGFQYFRARWQQYHVYHQQPVHIIQGGEYIAGVVEGVDDQGSILLRRSPGTIQAFHSGEISLRGQA